MKPNKNNIYIVWWQDAYVSLVEPDHNVKLTISVGWILEKTKEFMVLSHFWDGIEDKAEDPYTHIPIGMIKKVKKWTPKKP